MVKVLLLKMLYWGWLSFVQYSSFAAALHCKYGTKPMHKTFTVLSVAIGQPWALVVVFSIL
jgi:hypothetical protein